MFAHQMVRNSCTASSSSPVRRIYTTTEPTIRFIENDSDRRREKYDGSQWRLVCTWNDGDCTNFAYSCKLCRRHNTLRRNKPPRKYTKKSSMLPTVEDKYEIQIIAEYPANRSMETSSADLIKPEQSCFSRFSIDYLDEKLSLRDLDSQQAVSSSSFVCQSNDVQCLGSKTVSPNLNIAGQLAKNFPPLTEFEEEYLGALLISNCPTTCSLLDAQLYLHQEAISIVQKNYRLKMDTVSSEYFYDYLLRYPRIALHYRTWFSICKPFPPSTGSPIDMKMWSLAMMVRGSTMTEQMDEA